MFANHEEDITIRLAMAALDVEEVRPAEMEALLREAIKMIEMLRVMALLSEAVDLEELQLEDIEPEGNA